ncbi:GYF domain protein [Aspergillus sclerotiicarbonarius CBS 121057]|uniref:GYF domain protein n=1 Tax=Aspergillus sclerotiicarbonarius (strain CBS 121057 / IBT 28362) TaxID=1448318 RepID=A0A319EU08_ASPSB|nr:GYF domain protein [Aspergillus sclerotiicarbonarius CBS 121057]
MPTPLPSSFASAAAGNAHDSSTRRGDGPAGGEWSRTRMNGATQTFRRPSVATNPSHNRDASQPTSATTPTVGTYTPPHMSSNYPSSALRNGAANDTRYSKDQLLSLYRTQRESGILGKNVADYFVADWNPHETSPVNGAWGKREDSKDNPSGPEVCWDHGGQSEPLGLVDLTDDEKELFTLSVNSPLKPPPTNASKENVATGTGGRKLSISQGHMNNYNTASPSAGRPGPRRRETGDSTGNPMSPTTSGSRFFRDETNTSTPPPSLLRRKTDFRDASSAARWEEKEKENVARDVGAEVASPFGSLKRSSTNPLNVAPGASNSPWGSASQNASFSPMGAFGAFSLGAATTPTTEKKAGFGSLRGESRLKGLFSKDSSEDISAAIKEKPSLSSLERLGEAEGEKRAQSPWGEPVKTRTGRSETNPFSEEPRSGSAALGGSQEISTPSQAADQLGFAAFGMTSSIPGFRELMQSHENSRNPTPSLLQGHEPTSPTNTNPYQSPHGDRSGGGGGGGGGGDDDVDTDGSDIQNTTHPGISGLRDTSSAFGSIRRVGSGMDLPSIDRSQTSSAAGNRSFSSLGGLGGLSSLGGAAGWPSSAAVGTPTRERSAFAGGFGDPIFGTMGDLQSPSLSTLGGSGLFSPHAGISGTGSLGRSSKLGSLFPAAMQEQMQGEPGRPDLGTLDDGSRQPDPQQTDKPGQTSQPPTTSASPDPVSAVGSISTSMAPDVPPPSQTPGQVGAGSVPPAQQRTMVMPDRMRWIYRDPQGNIQGPWTGLEMHDWFKAGFFSPDLQIKKLEDPEFEPLAQLVRRIGNSREPFLVPQIGIPHGPDPSPGPWTGNTSGTAQPPFPGSFPSFGTTLTAEQQNALERRKQEEQYLMARQKEHLAQQQALMKQMQFQGVPHTMHPHQLQHHSSAHSLHSQPSFGSIASPIGFQPSPIQAPMQQPQSVAGFFDAAAPVRNPLQNVGPQVLGTDLVNSQDQLPALLDRLNVSRPDPFAFGTPSSFAARQPDSLFHQQQVASMLQDRARLQQEQEQFDSAQGDSLFDQQAREERLRQFHALRAQEGELGLRTAEGLPTHPATAIQPEEPEEDEDEDEEEQPTLTLSQQVQKAASAQRKQQEEQEQQEQLQREQIEQQSPEPTEAPWSIKGDSAMPQPFPPPPSASPLPAPAAQRNRQNVAESLAANSRSQTQTPVEAPTTSIAPWAKEANEMPKGPSLKEIQEAEARSAAQKEELAAAARRAQLLAEQERLSQVQAQAPGLPSTANWASAGSPATPTSSGSVWNSKGQAAPSGTAKKTLAQIQKEEEARKQRLAAAAAAAAAQNAAASPPAAPSSTGKRYADLASKAPAASPVSASASASGAWTTVGAGGKPKPPPVAPSGPRSTSSVTPVAVSPVKPKPATVATPRTVAVATPPANPNRAVEEFTKWAKLALGKGLNSNINVDDFVQQLLFLPAEAEIISDSVYANSQTLDGRRFAEEFIRRRKLADKGIVDPVSASAFAEKNAGGWSEVAKKGSSNAHREEDNSNTAFKVVAPRKKGKR